MPFHLHSPCPPANPPHPRPAVFPGRGPDRQPCASDFMRYLVAYTRDLSAFLRVASVAMRDEIAGRPRPSGAASAEKRQKRAKKELKKTEKEPKNVAKMGEKMNYRRSGVVV